jgi:hypothetical protein
MLDRHRLALALALATVVAFAPFGARAQDGLDQGHDHKPVTAIVRVARPADAKLYIISPKDGEVVTSPVTVRFGLAGMGVAPAGVAIPNTGHHHLIIDAELPSMQLPIPNDERHKHFGGGQTETTIDLAPGTHTLQLVLADKDHVPHEPPLVSEKITITVR